MLGWTNGNFDLYGCGSCGCPVCSSGSAICSRSEDVIQPRDRCTCVCPGGEGYVMPDDFANENIAGSVPLPIVMGLYPSVAADGSPRGDPIGYVSLTFQDQNATVTYTSSPGFLLLETYLYIGNTRLPITSEGSDSNQIELSSFPFNTTDQIEGALELLCLCLQVCVSPNLLLFLLPYTSPSRFII